MGPEPEGLGSLEEQEIRWHTHTGGWTPMTQGGDSCLHIQEIGKPSRHLDIGLPVSSTGSQHVVFQSQGHYSLLPTSWTSAQQTSLSFTVSWSLLRLKSIGSVMPSNLLNLCHPLLFLPLIFPSNRVFLNESFLHIRWPKYCSFSISPSNEYWAWLSLGLPGLISFLPKKISRVFKHHSLALNFLCDRAPTFVHVYWKKNSFDYTNLWWQSDGSTFL